MAKMPVSANLILNPSSGAPGFYVENVFCLPGVPSIMKAMLGSLNNLLVGGDPILSETINLRTVESEIAKSLTEVQNNNSDVEIGSYPFFKAGKLGVSIVLRSVDKSKIDKYRKEQEFDFSKMDESIKKIKDKINANNLELENKENDVNKAFIKMESIRAKLDSDKFSKDDLFYEIKEAEMKIAESKIKKNQDTNVFEIIDLYSVFVDKHGLIKGDLSTDGVHLNEAGYQVWVDYIKPIFDTL